ncbi:exonuclease domain-containing protein [Capnocytophaga sp.]|uniref:exonuclease domain-containing protein n=1 Tax=Capnocytophaga sp. TaxID=44737 RepID=UPI0026DD6702|nr:exonuclease domain-containing protein [Capnocytophaga sp.]MDO5105948.1 exonuclease domain-containing protein [Capnocytophaga sp.]
MYAILDIETTGGKYNEEGITEIAIYRFDGHEITDQFISLINPEREIQAFVTKLTGINNQMLKNAPKFYEVAKRIVEITENCIIVAHNANFDYRILQTEFQRLGYHFSRTSLCTVELAQQLIPGKESYSLGKLTRSLGIPISEQHRASGDALATVKLFKYLLEKDTKKEIITASVKNDSQQEIAAKHIRIIDELPERIGVYYMHNKNGKIIYIGKHKNIKKRVNQHFTSSTKLDAFLQRNTHKVTYEETGNELIAKLKEIQEIEQNKPKYNRRSRKKANNVNYILTANLNKAGYICFSTELIGTNNSFITSFETHFQAQNFLYQITEEFKLCPKLQNLSQARKNCHNYTIKKCNGACIEQEPVATYNERAQQVLEKYGFVNQTIAIIDKGRSVDEKSLILIINGVVKGYGFFNLNYQLSQLEIIENLVTPLPDSLQNRHIIQTYIRNHSILKITNLNKQKTFNNNE